MVNLNSVRSVPSEATRLTRAPTRVPALSVGRKAITLPPAPPPLGSASTLQAFREFYEDIFTSSRTFASDRSEILEKLSKCLSSEERDSCEGLLTAEECLTALNGMVKNS